MMKRNFFKITAYALVAFGLTLPSCKEDDPIVEEDEVYVENADGSITVNASSEGTGTTTWVSDKVYILNGLVFVNSGQTLTIEPGTLIKAKPGQETDASALIVACGGTLMAEGTAAEPIIFTAEADNAEGTGVNMTDRGLWGGLIVLGEASLNSDPGTTQIEGIPTTEARGNYGGSNDSDNSGTITYVSIRHGGTDIGEGNEINGLSLGGVGSGTTFDFIEVVANQDDGVEFFGGMPQLKHILVAYCADDCYDYDEGFRGKGQFWAAIQDPDAGDRMGEHDGGTTPETAMPYAIPMVSNATYYGRGAGKGKKVMTMRDNAGGKYYNSIFANQDKGIDIELLNDGDNNTYSKTQDSYKQFESGNLVIASCSFYAVGGDDTSKLFAIGISGDSTDVAGDPVLEDPADAESKQLVSAAFAAAKSAAHANFEASFASNNNEVVTTSGFISATNPVPASTSAADFSSLDSWFTSVTYRGAFDPATTNWASGWTLMFK